MPILFHFSIRATRSLSLSSTASYFSLLFYLLLTYYYSYNLPSIYRLPNRRVEVGILELPLYPVIRAPLSFEPSTLTSSLYPGVALP